MVIQAPTVGTLCGSPRDALGLKYPILTLEPIQIKHSPLQVRPTPLIQSLQCLPKKIDQNASRILVGNLVDTPFG